MKPEARTWRPAQACAALLLLVTALGGAEARCAHGDVQRRVVGATQVGYGGRRDARRGSPPRPRPIRVATHYPAVPNMVLSQEERRRLNSSVQEAVRLIGELLAVVPVRGKLLLSRDMDEYCKSVWRNISLPNFNRCGHKNDNYRHETCLDIVIPDDHLQGYSVWPAEGTTPTVIKQDGPGVIGADFILYVKAAETRKCRQEASVIAYAAYCKVDQYGRPIAGAVTFCHSRLRGVGFDHRRTVLTTVHELLHVLGFSKDLYSSWLDCASAPFIGANCSSRASVTNTDDQGSTRIYSQSVIKQMQLHLNSTSADLGAVLENRDSPGIASSHWESRILQGSIMTATMGSPDHTFIDTITLAAMADTGWYQVNYSQGWALLWGQGQGDSFGLTSTCHNDTSGYFCTGSGLGCHYLHMEKGSCVTDEFLDGCRIYKPFLNQSECWKADNARNAGNLSETGEIYGQHSRCFFANLSREAPSASASVRSLEGACYLHRCLGLDTFEVKVQGSAWLPCRAGHNIQVPGYHGHLSCPQGKLCQTEVGRGTVGMMDDSTHTSPRPVPTPPPPLGHAESPRPWVRVAVTLAVRCREMDGDGAAEEGVQSLVSSTAIPRCQIRHPRVCSPFELCFELSEYSGCSRHTVTFLFDVLKRSIRKGHLHLTIRGENCTAISIRSGSGPGAGSGHPQAALSAPGSVLPTALCSSLALALVGGLVGAGIYHRLYRARGRVHAGGHGHSDPERTFHRRHGPPISLGP